MLEQYGPKRVASQVKTEEPSCQSRVLRYDCAVTVYFNEPTSQASWSAWSTMQRVEGESLDNSKTETDENVNFDSISYRPDTLRSELYSTRGGQKYRNVCPDTT